MAMDRDKNQRTAESFPLAEVLIKLLTPAKEHNTWPPLGVNPVISRLRENW